LYLSKASPVTLIYHSFKNLFSITKRRTEIWFSIIVMNIGMAK
jgi:ABC-type multidrug transport system permease subunit